MSRRKLRGGFLHSRFGDRLLERQIWVPTRDSLAVAFLIGLPVTMIPFLPLQSLAACALAFWLRGNLPVTFFLQFLSTPATAIVHLPLCYLAGKLVLGADLAAEWERVWADPMGIVTRGSLGALYLGAVVLGPLTGVAGYLLTKFFWREKPIRGAGAGGVPGAPPEAEKKAA